MFLSLWIAFNLKEGKLWTPNYGNVNKKQGQFNNNYDMESMDTYEQIFPKRTGHLKKYKKNYLYIIIYC